MRIKDKYHLTYCTNIHAGGDWEETFTSLKQNLPEIKKAVSPNDSFGLGLRLSNTASVELDNGKLQGFKDWLDENDCYVFTMNGFPYGNFHGEPVKDNVHVPDWTTKERLEYTQRLFKQLDFLAPEGMECGISTSPVSYKHWFDAESKKEQAFVRGAQHMVQVALQLHKIEKESGRYMHLDVEPEPDGFLENTQEVLDFYKDYLIPEAIKAFESFKLSTDKVEELLKRYITVCYDVCHFALAYEAPNLTFERFKEVGIKTGKIQISAALKILYQQDKEEELWSTLAQFNEPVYLHQVTEKVNGTVKTYNDLPIVLEKKAPFDELRSHFHVPIFLEDYGLLQSTQDQIVKVLEYLEGHFVSNHIEVETYTWDVLPDKLKVPITESIARELSWMKSRLK
ncbi:metabolite traffic protein EboE [Muricauda sp. CAU 1633]|uniref:metabolite traffic protein EboE n=1 Tax=Allomuricauda sp. CAU 1633 TaxID=2816036 RepID=UPI001A8F7592|nr:metabolite traffic protein EboE [Muricauda sp. CAU 1633]MBO0322289.1 metabolite traffic protein EboE [Muricauda sp. CAU 1633]